ncbi:MAG: helix-turn-helix transcriptional regulator [Clostridia bacterium]|nr:helix-turn-helix transcriptional regulator [Clostridia bacterium]
MNLSDVVERVGYFRNQAKLSARELSLRVGKHEGYINKLECQDFNLPTEMLLEIVEALEVEPEEFFSKNYQNYKIDKVLYDLIMALPQKKKESIIELLQK